MTNESNDELLKEAVRLLRVIATPQIREMEERFEAALLTSKKRSEMWALMNGTRTLADIASEVGVSREAVRLFLREAEDSFPLLIETVEGPDGQRPARQLG